MRQDRKLCNDYNTEEAPVGGSELPNTYHSEGNHIERCIPWFHDVEAAVAQDCSDVSNAIHPLYTRAQVSVFTLKQRIKKVSKRGTITADETF